MESTKILHLTSGFMAITNRQLELNEFNLILRQIIKCTYSA
jgi:hypothetical protein